MKSKTDLRFDRTCIASPEQYDVYVGRKKVAYIRLRYGVLVVEYKKPFGDLIYQHIFNDRWKGSFYDKKQREKYMKIISNKIKLYLRTKEKKR